MNRRTRKLLTALLGISTLLLAMSLARDAIASPAGSDSTADDAAIRQVVAGFSNGWNAHDAHAMCISLADNVQWVNWLGTALHSREQVEQAHAKLFAGIYKHTHRNDTVKVIRYLAPNLVSVDNYWTMTGAKKRDGTDWPYRAGYVTYLMAKRNGRWEIIVAHTADFNAKAPGPARR
ncbi:MAG TPA: SgcJ/EcaC family oxidoreductase [Candidatus Dormibacteraeota bacterium]|nr:SgcJ/EcaC family oxidoreductase [Candidatus Dormibacteraeota bacterium]